MDIILCFALALLLYDYVGPGGCARSRPHSVTEPSSRIQRRLRIAPRHGHSRRTGTAKAQLRGARQPHVLRQPAVQRPRSAQACASNGPCIAHRPQEFKAQSRMIARRSPAPMNVMRTLCHTGPADIISHNCQQNELSFGMFAHTVGVMTAQFF